MKRRKTLQDLTIKDNFLFGAVIRVEEKPLLSQPDGDGIPGERGRV